MFLTEKIILDAQNICSFLLGLYSIYIYKFYIYEEKTYAMIHLKIMEGIILKHAIIDLQVNKSFDVKLHHLFIFGFISYYKYYNINQEDVYIFSTILTNTEISTIFYVLNYWLRENTVLYNLNRIVFYLSFFKFRIYDFYTIVEDNRELNKIFEKYGESDLSNIASLSIYGLYILNLYWFTIMTKVFVKKVLKPYFTENLNNTLCTYLRLINPLMTSFLYLINSSNLYIGDAIGITILSFTRHTNVDVILHDIEINELTKEKIVYILYDCFSIHLRSYLSILTNFYYHKNFHYVLVLSCCFHLSSILVGNTTLLLLSIEAEKYNKHIKAFHKIIWGYPIAFDCYLMISNSPNDIAIPFLLINILFVLVLFIKPFYKLNETALHIILIGQTYYSSLSNINSISH